MYCRILTSLPVRILFLMGTPADTASALISAHISPLSPSTQAKMQTVVASSSRAVAVSRKAPARRVAVSVVCKASPVPQAVQKLVAAAVSLPAMIVAHPAYALVDERMNGDGTGKVLGVNNEQVRLPWQEAG